MVAQLTFNQSDPLHDLGSSTAGLSSKGALSRAKLQAELAAQKGTFFLSVLQSMARRMNPSLAAEVGLSTLRDQGVTPTQYLEKKLGLWQMQGHWLHHVADRPGVSALDCSSTAFAKSEPSVPMFCAYSTVSALEKAGP